MIKKEDAIISIFFRPKAYRLFLKIDDKNYTSRIAKEVNITYSHAVKIIGILKDAEIVESSKSGRTMIISLTSKGRQIQNLLFKINNLFKEAVNG